MSPLLPPVEAKTGFERAVKLLNKRKAIYLISRGLLQQIVKEMADCARQVRNAERFVAKEAPSGTDQAD